MKRFWDKVEKSDKPDGCWKWTGCYDGRGYGEFCFKGKQIRAHRVAWMLSNNTDIPRGMCVLRSCSMRDCVNPRHLFLAKKGQTCRTRTIEERFWANVKKIKNGCWEWTGYQEGNRGRFRSHGKLLTTRRVVWELIHGPISETVRILSTCHNPLCVNPSHLYKYVLGDYEKRFWSKVKKTDGCWIWQGRIGNRGYGTFSINGTTEGAHRFSWIMANGRPVPNGLWVLHRFDNPLCVRPDHLFLGTRSDNQIDCARKGRLGGVKLSFEKATEIRKKYFEKGISQKMLGEEYGVCSSQISLIVTDKKWKEWKPIKER